MKRFTKFVNKFFGWGQRRQVVATVRSQRPTRPLPSIPKQKPTRPLPRKPLPKPPKKKHSPESTEISKIRLQNKKLRNERDLAESKGNNDLADQFSVKLSNNNKRIKIIKKPSLAKTLKLQIIKSSVNEVTQNFTLEKEFNTKSVSVNIKDEKNVTQDDVKSYLGINDLSNNINGTVTLAVIFYYSDSLEDRVLTPFKYSGSASELHLSINSAIQDFFVEIGPGGLNFVSARIVNISESLKNSVSIIQKMKLREVLPLKFMLFNGFIDNNIPLKNPNDDACVPRYLKRAYKKISKKSITALGNEPTSEDLLEWCKKYSISMRMYDCEFNLIIEYKSDSRSYKDLEYMAHNGHMYVMKKSCVLSASKLRRMYIKNYDETVILNSSQELLDKINEIKENGEKVDWISPNLYKNEIQKMKHKDIYYIVNPDYKETSKILEDYGLPKNSTIRLSNIWRPLVETYTNRKCYTYNDKLDRLPKSGFQYTAPLGPPSEIKAIDANTSYGSALSQLDNLLFHDKRFHETREIDLKGFNINFKVDYMYQLDPKKSSIYFMNKELYSGNHIYECLKMMNIPVIFSDDEDSTGWFSVKNHHITNIFTDIVEVECGTKPNYYKKMIKDITDNYSHDVAKVIITRMIGCMGKRIRYNEYKTEFVKMCTREEAELSVGEFNPLPQKFCERSEWQSHGSKGASELYGYITKEVKNTKVNLFNNKVLHCQILDKARRNVIKKIIFMGISAKDIAYIEVDSIGYLDRPKYIFIEKNGLNGWKDIKTKEFDKNIWTFKNEGDIREDIDDNNNIIYTCYAGTGKTTSVIRAIKGNKSSDLYKRLFNNDSILITSPQHKPLVDYKDLGVEVETIDHFIKGTRKMPEKKTIVIDEYGLCRLQHWLFIDKLKYMGGYEIIALGDPNQLTPVEEAGTRLVNSSFIRGIFTKTGKMIINHRNNFTIEYYDTLIHNEDLDFAKQQIEQHSTDWKECEKIICYINKTCRIYNDKKLKYLGFDSICSKGVKVITKIDYDKKRLSKEEIKEIIDEQTELYGKYVNDKDLICLKEKIAKRYRYKSSRRRLLMKKKDVYIGYSGVVTDVTETHITVDDKYTFTKNEFTEIFRLGYAVTAYHIQGDSVESFFYPSDDYKYLKDGRVLYTIISRLKF